MHQYLNRIFVKNTSQNSEAKEKIVKKALRFVSTLLVAVMVLLAAALAGARLAGFRVYAVLSGSMEPAYPTGSLIYTRKVDPFALKAGDVITFRLDEDTAATHRVVEVVPDGEDPDGIRFRTKGDANETEDGSLVRGEDVVGTPVFTVPYLGYAANYIRKPPGIYVAISVGAVLLILVFLPDIFADSGRDGEAAPRKKKGGTDTK